MIYQRSEASDKNLNFIIFFLNRMFKIQLDELNLYKYKVLLKIDWMHVFYGKTNNYKKVRIAYSRSSFVH